jgi:hypothetical protein
VIVKFSISGLRKYRGRVSFLPVGAYHPRMLQKGNFRRAQSEIYSHDLEDRTVTLKRATSVVVEEPNDSVSWAESVSEHSAESQTSGEFQMPPLSAPVPADWVTVEGEFITISAVFMTHLGPDLVFSKDRHLDEGQIDFCIIHSSIPRAKILKSFIDLAEGKVTPDNDIEFFRVKAFRIEPYTEKGYMVVDGEQVEYGPIQGYVRPGLARVMCTDLVNT